jgi:DNA-binding transcriptional regulator YiaG
MKKYKTEIKMAIHQDAALLHKAGLISDERMRHFDEACLVKPPVQRVPAQKPPGFARSGAPVFAGGK